MGAVDTLRVYSTLYQSTITKSVPINVPYVVDSGVVIYAVHISPCECVSGVIHIILHILCLVHDICKWFSGMVLSYFIYIMSSE